jgi:predicted DCC family thiol-disulfide oxidoreductase YuxK
MEALQRLDRCGQIEARAAQEAGVRERFRLTKADTSASAWTIDAGGHRFGGAAAIFAALAAALGASWLLAIYRIPPIRLASELAYRWIAANRSHFPGVTPYCQRPGAACPDA